MTSQILNDMLTHRYIRIEDTNLLIFDECHHAVVDHPMRIIMKHFASCPKENQPRVLGNTNIMLNRIFIIELVVFNRWLIPVNSYCIVCVLALY